MEMSSLLKKSARSGLFLLSTVMPSVAARAVSWFPFGPDGGDARSFAVDPHDHTHLYLGALTGWLYESHDEGHTWKRLALVGGRSDLVLDNVLVDAADARHLTVGAWAPSARDGGLFESHDGGATWVDEPDMHGESVRSLAASASDPKLLVAGTLTGVYRSADGGTHWRLISPAGSSEIHEVESVAIDPVDPRVIYAGTWHLPWKTVDGGLHWTNIKEGVIDDSDVFSIIVDPANPSTVYASACSGIYKSENAGGKFQKVEGIPSEARRTRVLMQDPQHRDTVFAGTTEGLFRTGDAGKIWIRTTGPDVIVNDVYIDPTDSNKILLATDHSGVLSSNDGGSSFQPSNSGFSARHLSSYVAEARNPARVYVGVLNDKQWGGVFRSENGGLSWAQESDGLGGSDVFSLAQAPDATILAGTGHGLYRLKDHLWERVADVAVAPAASHGAETRRSAKAAPSSSPAKKPRLESFDGAVYAMAVDGENVFAASSQGLLVSKTSGVSWTTVEGLAGEEFYFLGGARSVVLAANLKTMRLSKDGGVSWKAISQPPGLTQLAAVAVDGQGGLWAGGREGVFLSENGGATWQGLPNLAVNDVNSLYYDARSQRVFVTDSGIDTTTYAVQLPERRVASWNTGWRLRMVRPVGDHLIGLTPFDGVVVQPRMVDSAVGSHP
jgi:photosystem II stability/assembly factor-like uncharacterized protein